MCTGRRHELKTWPQFFEPVWTGDKTFEVRLDDRGYQKGDTVVLREWDRRRCTTCSGTDHRADCTGYTGRSITARIGHVTASTPPKGNQRGFVGNGYVVFALCDLVRADGSAPAAMARVAAQAASAGGA